MSIDGSTSSRSHPGSSRVPGQADAQPHASPAGNEPVAGGLGELSGDRVSSTLMWLKRGSIALGVIVVGIVGFSLIPKNSSSLDGPQLTHIVKRGNLQVTVTEQGMLESSENTEIKCKVRGENTVIWVVEGGTIVEPGDELIRLDTLALEDAIAERTKYAHWSRSGAVLNKANVERLKLAVKEYEEGRFPAQVMRLEKDLAIGESNLRSARAMLEYSQMMRDRGYESDLDVEQREFRVKQLELDVEYRKTEIDVLKEYTRRMELETIKGDLNAAVANLAASEERAVMDEKRRDLAKEELEHCVMYADRGGLVIHPSAAAWKAAPDIEEGATVHKDQTLLLMPDLTKMQVKVGVHESVIERIKPGLTAIISLPDRKLAGEVITVAEVAEPAGWWTGNVVKYDTIIQLPNVEGLRPGMSAEVEILISEHKDVVTVPVAAVIETEEGFFCWVKNQNEVKRRPLQVGDSNDVFIVVEAGLKEGDEVVLNPLAYIEEAQEAVLKTTDRNSGKDDKSGSPGADSMANPETKSSK